MGNMKTFAATEAQNRFGELLDTAQSEPVTIQRKGRAVVVVLSVSDYEHLQRLEEIESGVRLAESLADYRAERTVSSESVHEEIRRRIEQRRTETGE